MKCIEIKILYKLSRFEVNRGVGNVAGLWLCKDQLVVEEFRVVILEEWTLSVVGYPLKAVLEKAETEDLANMKRTERQHGL
ncbi:hypothetical protein TorRG33x02_065710, partial [Trema orientale]